MPRMLALGFNMDDGGLRNDACHGARTENKHDCEHMDRAACTTATNRAMEYWRSRGFAAVFES